MPIGIMYLDLQIIATLEAHFHIPQEYRMPYKEVLFPLRKKSIKSLQYVAIYRVGICSREQQTRDISVP